MYKLVHTNQCVLNIPVWQCCADSIYDYLDRRRKGWGIWHMLSQQLVLQQPLLCWEDILGTAVLSKGRHSQGNYHWVWGQGMQTGLGQQILRFEVFWRGKKSYKQQVKHQLQHLCAWGWLLWAKHSKGSEEQYSHICIPWALEEPLCRGLCIFFNRQPNVFCSYLQLGMSVPYAEYVLTAT